MRLQQKRSRHSERQSVFDSSCSAKRFAVLKVGSSVLAGNKAFHRVALFLQALRVLAVGLNVRQTGLGLSSGRQLCLARPSPKGRDWGPRTPNMRLLWFPVFLQRALTARIVSVGRGGSDLSAVVLAIGLRSSHCELVKDVPGYFEEDPHENTGARHLPSLAFKQALRMARRGCELVQRLALRAAAEIGLPLVVRDLDEPGLATIVCSGSRRGTTEFPGGLGLAGASRWPEG
jgi:hypothetical protein